MKDKKVIIFDFDHTLYSGNIGRKKNYAYNMLRNAFDELSNEQFDALLSKHGVRNISKLTNDQVVDIVTKEGKDAMSTVTPYLDSEDELIQVLQGGNVVDGMLFKDLLAKGYEIHIVSNSPNDSVRRNAEALGIRISGDIQIHGMPYLSIFKNFKKVSKLHRYREILESSRVAPSDCVVLGNDVVADVLPAMALGMHGVVCKDCRLLTTKNIEYCVNDPNVANIGEVTTLEYQMLNNIVEHHLPVVNSNLGKYTSVTPTISQDVQIKVKDNSSSEHTAGDDNTKFTKITTPVIDEMQP